MRAFAASLFVALVLAAGCSDDEGGGSQTERLTPTAEASPDKVVAPPAAYLLDASGSPVEGGTGTYCWKLGNEGLCRDLVGPRTNVEPIRLDPGSPAEFEFDAGTPRELTVDWTPAGEMQSAPGEGNTLDWGPEDGASYEGPSFTDALTAPNEPGLYVLAAFALFPEGDVTYGFYIEVR